VKKILFGLTLILFAILLVLIREFTNYFRNDVITLVLLIAPFVGIAFAIGGLMEKEQ
jgi:hypothetical protein